MENQQNAPVLQPFFNKGNRITEPWQRWLQKLKTRGFKEGYEFNEWLHGKTGKPQGEPYQAWSAGAYIYAYECVKQKKVLFF